MWLVALIVTALFRDSFGSAWITCIAGVGVGAFGTSTFLLQRRAAVRGDRGAQQGLL